MLGLRKTAATSTSTSQPVGTKLPNELGLYDMSGNVSEWCWDWYGTDYPTGAVADYAGAAAGTSRVRRGGQWNNDITPNFTLASRYSSNPILQNYGIGFRVVRPASSADKERTPIPGRSAGVKPKRNPRNRGSCGIGREKPKLYVRCFRNFYYGYENPIECY